MLVHSSPVQESGCRVLGAGRGQMRVPSFEEWQAMDLVYPEPAWTGAERPRSEIFGCLQGEFQIAAEWDSHETNHEVAELFDRLSSLKLRLLETPSRYAHLALADA